MIDISTAEGEATDSDDRANDRFTPRFSFWEVSTLSFYKPKHKSLDYFRYIGFTTGTDVLQQHRRYVQENMK